MSNSDIEELLKNPSQTEIPTNLAQQCFIAVRLVELSNEKNFDAIVEYIMRPEFSRACQIMVMTQIVREHVKLCDTDGFVKWAKQVPELGL